MAHKSNINYIEVFKEKLIDFATEEDPILSMLKWTARHLTHLKAEAKVGAEWTSPRFCGHTEESDIISDLEV